MPKKWVIVSGAVALAAVVLVAAQLMLTRKTVAPSSSATTATSTASSTSGGGSGVQSSTRAGAADNATDGTATGTIKPFPPLRNLRTTSTSTTALAAPGQTLAPLKTAPDRLISAVRVGTVPEGSRYTVRMRPYGLGPMSALGSTIVIHVDTVTPVTPAPTNVPLKGADVLALADTTHGGAITQGGTYTATITFRSDGKRMLPILSDAKAAG